jgi:hypothetical protein
MLHNIKHYEECPNGFGWQLIFVNIPPRKEKLSYPYSLRERDGDLTHDFMCKIPPTADLCIL